MAFLPSSSSSDSTDSTEKKKKPLEHLATINGCGTDGFCTLKGRDAAMRKKMEDMKIKTEGENKEQSVT